MSLNGRFRTPIGHMPHRRLHLFVSSTANFSFRIGSSRKGWGSGLSRGLGRRGPDPASPARAAAADEVYVIPFSHLDLFWAGTREECLARGNQIIAQAVKLAKQSPDFLKSPSMYQCKDKAPGLLVPSIESPS